MCIMTDTVLGKVTKKLLVLIILPCFVGCYITPTYEPVSSMSRSQLQQEYLDTQYQIKIAESKPLDLLEPQRPTSYTAHTYGNTTRITPNNSNDAFVNGWNSQARYEKQQEITDLLSRQRELGMEMYRRGINLP